MSIEVILGFNKFLAPLPGIRKQSFSSSVINLYISFGLNKFSASLSGTRKNFKNQYFDKREKC